MLHPVSLQLFAFNAATAVCVNLHHRDPLELGSLYASINYKARNSSICSSVVVFWCVSIQIGKHDEAWMILKQVHDTNMRAKGEPEKVFTVSLRKPPACEAGHSFLGSAQLYFIPPQGIFSIPTISKRTQILFVCLKLDVRPSPTPALDLQ